MNQSVDT